MAFKIKAIKSYDWKVTVAKFGKGLAIAVLVYVVSYLSNSTIKDPMVLAIIPLLTAMLNLLKAKWGIDVFGLG